MSQPTDRELTTRRPTKTWRKPVRIGVIIPVLDESSRLERLLTDLGRATEVFLDVCVADGGSADRSIDVARRFGARVVQSPPGRGRQMNAARAVCDAPWLLFLHADSRLPDPSSLRRAIDALRLETARHGDQVAGHFRVTFDRTSSGHELAFRFLERKTALNRPNTTNGDQGLLLAAGFFDELGGFDESLPFLEDQRLAEAIRRRGRWVTLPGELHTSSRRFEREGFARRYFVMAVIMAVWSAGIDEFFELAPDLYRRHAETDLLRLQPVIDALWETMRRIGPRRTVRAWLDVGGFTRRNGWQLAFWVDTVIAEATGVECDDVLRWFDETLADDVDHPVVDAAIAAGLFAVVMGVVGAFATD